jgi:hypothetical protein
MRKLPLDAFREIAKRVIWFEPPEEALEDTVRFVAYAMDAPPSTTCKPFASTYLTMTYDKSSRTHHQASSTHVPGPTGTPSSVSIQRHPCQGDLRMRSRAVSLAENPRIQSKVIINRDSEVFVIPNAPKIFVASGVCGLSRGDVSVFD